MIPRHVFNFLCLTLLIFCSGSTRSSAQEYFPWNSGLGANQPANAIGKDFDLPANPLQEVERHELDTVDGSAAAVAENTNSPGADSTDGQRNFSDYLADQAQQLTSREGTASTIQVGLLLGTSTPSTRGILGLRNPVAATNPDAAYGVD